MPEPGASQSAANAVLFIKNLNGLRSKQAFAVQLFLFYYPFHPAFLCKPLS
jgi:hypothetical protein